MKINVLSLFDGMSCGQIALERAGIRVANYFASEIKKHAIKVTKANYPQTKHIGDITKIKGKDLPKINLLIGGSPCQDFSVARTGQGLSRDGVKGNKSYLLLEYFRLLNEVKPDFFLLENVLMKKKHAQIITRNVGVEPIQINSNLLSFQNRNRLYWTNISGVTIPEDKNVSFQDYKSSDLEYERLFKVKKTPSRITMWGDGISGKCPNVTSRKKVNCLTLKQDRWSNSGLVKFDDFCRYLTTNELESAQTVPVGYCDCLTKNQSENVLGDGWTIDVIAHIFGFLPKDWIKTS